jgi:FkbM family methyltransferase
VRPKQAETTEALERHAAMNPAQQLDVLLRETPAAAREREQSAFEKVSRGCSKVVIFGAGRLGRKILAGLSSAGLEPIAFADNNPHLWGNTIDGLPVLAPQETAEEYTAEATFVLAIWHPSRAPLMCELLAQLREMRVRVAPFPLLFWQRPSTFLPYFFWDLPSNLLLQRVDIVSAFELLDDDASRQAFAAQLQLRLRADFDALGMPAPDEQYFPSLFSMSRQECFVDCGSYTGDTIQAFLSQTKQAYRKVIAFEADHAILPRLETLMNELGSCGVLHKAAVGAHNGIVRFTGDGIGGGCVTEARGMEVPCVRLDDALAGEHVSFIKMDIEGAELHALEGAQHVIRRDHPVLAVCGYHTPDHLWRIPISLKTLAPDSSIFLRCHCADGLDSVYYSVPPERRAWVTTSRVPTLSTAAPLRMRQKGSAS